MGFGVDAVVETFDEIVKPDGGSVKLVAVEGSTLRIHYAPGVNEECATCVMEPEALAGMMEDMLKQHEPSIDSVVVETPKEGAAN
ncbi:NifU family protein [Myxococcota bacterium]|nr:NifU family protein [Myxococcota bacterium]